jgi:hypothetical protein
MPRFYYHVRKGDLLIEDTEGVEVPGLRAAFDEAEQGARDLMAERVKHGQVIDGHQFEVHDELGTKLFTVPFKSVLRIN